MDLERIGGRHRDNSHHFAAESEALDQIAKEVRFINNVYYYPDCQQSMESCMVFLKSSKLSLAYTTVAFMDHI